jgi:putative membrane protein
MKILVFAAAMVIATPAIAETMAEKTGINSTLKIAPTTNDFVTEAAVSDMFEIQSSTLASGKLTGAGKAFADRMVADHTKTTADLTAAAKAGNIPVPSTMDSAHRKMLDKLQSLNGDDFSKQYFKDQVSAHKTAVNLFDRYGKGGKDAKLKDWAAQTLPTLKEHLKMAEALNK